MAPSPEFQQVLRRIREDSDLLAIVGRVVELRRKGGRFWGCCPFHGEKTPSFCVRPEVGYYHCFGCGEGGDIIKFVMKTENLPFIDAVKKLAKELRIEVPSFSSVPQAQRDAAEKLQGDIEAANRFALEFYAKNLAEGRNPLANEYLPKRGLGPEMIARFKLGASLDGWSTLTDAMLRAGFDAELLVTGGLSVRSDKGSLYDRFRNRLMFPIHDHNGRCIGFGGRTLVDDPKSPKYMNSAETPLYKKSRSLYALDVAQKSIRDSGHAYLCEGYMDVISAHAAGIENAVGSLGTALTPEQSKLLRRFAQRVFFFYDGDDAGRKAMLRGGESLLAADIDTKVLLLPREDDPDTFVRREGAEAVRAMRQGAREFFDFAIDEAIRDLDMAGIGGQAALVERLLPFLAASPNELVREAAITRLITRAPAIPRDAVRRMIERRSERRGPEPSGPPDDDGEAGAPSEAADSRGPQHAGRGDAVERAVLKLMLESREALEVIRARLHHDWIQDPRVAPWVFRLVDEDLSVHRLLNTLESDDSDLPADRSLVTELIAWDMPAPKDPGAAALEILARIHERHQRRILGELLRELSDTLSPEAQQRALSAIHREQRHRLSVAPNRHPRRKSN